MRWEELEAKLLAIPGFKEGFDELYPYSSLSVELNGLRADMDMTQTEFGRLVGVPQSTIARLESGQHNPSVGTLKRIAQATGTELVIEFRRPSVQRKRRAKAQAAAASSPSRPHTDESLAASPTED